MLFRAQRIDETGKSVTVPVMIAGKVRGEIAVLTQSPYLKEGVDEALAAWKQVKAEREALSKEQPWNIQHEDQLWKGKVVGLPQKTGEKETLTSVLNPHAKESARIAIELAKDANVAKVFLNRGIKKASGNPIQGSNRRPDVTYVTKDGKVHQVEVQSRTDDYDMLLDRMKLSKKQLPENMQGDTKVIHYKDYIRAIDK